MLQPRSLTAADSPASVQVYWNDACRTFCELYTSFFRSKILSATGRESVCGSAAVAVAALADDDAAELDDVITLRVYRRRVESLALYTMKQFAQLGRHHMTLSKFGSGK